MRDRVGDRMRGVIGGVVREREREEESLNSKCT